MPLCPQPWCLTAAMVSFKVAGHPARSAAHIRIENEWEICHMDLSLRSKCMAEIVSQI